VANAAVLTGPVVNPANGHTYYLLDEDTWTNSESEAITFGGHLVTINDAAEDQWVFDTFSGFAEVDRNLWLGLNDADIEGTFVWSSGETSLYTNFAPGEPSGGPGGSDDYIRINAESSLPTGAWGDSGNNSSLTIYGVVEIVPEPGTVALLGISGLLATRRRRRP